MLSIVRALGMGEIQRKKRIVWVQKIQTSYFIFAQTPSFATQ